MVILRSGIKVLPIYSVRWDLLKHGEVELKESLMLQKRRFHFVPHRIRGVRQK